MTIRRMIGPVSSAEKGATTALKPSLATENGSGGHATKVVEVGDLRVYPDEFVAELAGERLPLTHKEFQLLVLFALNPGRLLRRDRIAREVWGGPQGGRTIDIHVARLRARLPKGAIETVIRLGYRFVLS